MPHLLPDNEIIKLIDRNVIQSGKKENAEGIKYDFTLGTKVLKSKYKIPVDLKDLNTIERSNFAVDPGEVVFVLTEERLNLPNDIYVVLVPKRKLSHDGIMILGGLSVDPYYNGKLLIGIYNFSSSPFHLLPGKKIIGSHFYQLRDDEIDSKQNKPDTSIDDFPEELIRLMEKYTPISTQSLLDKVTNIDYKLEEFKKEFRDRENWFDRFQNKLDEQEKLVAELLTGLREERDNRSSTDKELDAEIKNFRNELKNYSQTSYKNSVWVGIGSAIVLGIIVWALTTIFGPKNKGAQLPPININIDSTYQKNK